MLEPSKLIQQPQHVEIILNDDNDDAEQIAAERDAEHSTKKVRHRKHKRPFYRRVFNYLRNALTGVNFSSANGKCTHPSLNPYLSLSFASFLFLHACSCAHCNFK